MAMPPVIWDVVPAGAANRPGRLITPRYITVHETANPKTGMDALAHRNYVHNGGGPQLTSYNYVVDDHETYGLIPVGESSNHAGTPMGNASGVAMELCVNIDGDWHVTRDRAADLIAGTFQSIPSLVPYPTGMVYHGTWNNGTACPARLRANNNAQWDDLVARVGLRLSADPEIITFDGIPYIIRGGFAAFYRALGDLAGPVLGYPMSDDHRAIVDGVARNVQDFERGILGWYPPGTPDGQPPGSPWHIRLLTRAEQRAVEQSEGATHATPA